MENGSMLNGNDVRRDARGRPTKIRGEFDLPASDSAEDGVLAFLSQHADELQVPAGSLAVSQAADTPSGRVVRFNQTFDGVPVFGSEVVVAVDNDRKVRQVDVALPAVSAPSPAADDTRSAKLKPADAVKAATQALDGPTLRQKPAAPTEVYYPTDDGLRRAYVVLVLTREPAHDWRVIVDAHTGEVLSQEDILMALPDGQGRVFDPNPVVTANNAALRDPAATVGTCSFAGTAQATIDNERVTRTLRDLTLSGGLHRLEGPFARAHNFANPNTTFPQEAGANDFNYPSSDERFEAVNVYYHLDTFQRYLQDGSRGPAVTTAHNSQIRYDPHDASSSGAFFSPGDLGLHFGNSGPCRPDRAEDGHVSLHEYGHAIQNNQVPNWGLVNPTTGRRETRAMGEGYGDILATVFFADHGGGFQREVFEQWIFGDVGGLRRVDGTKVYPTDWVEQEHADGEIWSAALWNVYRAIGGDSMNPADRAAARDAVIKTVTLSHHRLTASASMPEGAEAVMVENAALDQYRGRHLMQMLDSFHARGLLPCSASTDLEITDGATFWNSPDLWIRNANDNGTTHQNPEAGQDNWFYARVRNNGSQAARAFVVTFNVKPFAGTEFVYPNDFVPYVSAAVGFNLAPGASTIVKAKWPEALVPGAGTHTCLTASVYTPVETPTAGAHVWEHNNLAQKNLTIVDLIPGDFFIAPVLLGNLGRIIPGRHRLEVRRPKEFPALPVSLVHRDPKVLRELVTAEVTPATTVTTSPARRARPVVRFLEPSRVEIAHRGVVTDPVRIDLGRDSAIDLGPSDEDGAANGHGAAIGATRAGDAVAAGALDADLATDREGHPALAFRPGATVGMPLAVLARSTKPVNVKIGVPPEAKPGQSLNVDVVQRDERGNVVGGVSFQVNVVAKR